MIMSAHVPSTGPVVFLGEKNKKNKKQNKKGKKKPDSV